MRRKAVAKEGLRAPLFCLGVTLLIAAGGTAAAQTVEQSDLELCAGLETPELKLACFEALTAIERREAPPAAEAAPQSLPKAVATDKELVTAGTAAAVAGSDAGFIAPAPAADDDPVDVADEIARAPADEEQADLVDVPGQEAPDEFQVDVADDLGQEHLDEKKVDEKEEQVIRVTVSEVVRGSYDVLYFRFTNGQVWRQTESRHFGYPRDGEFDVIINTGMLGDYRLRLAAGGPMTRIRRVK